MFLVMPARGSASARYGNPPTLGRIAIPCFCAACRLSIALTQQHWLGDIANRHNMTRHRFKTSEENNKMKSESAKSLIRRKQSLEQTLLKIISEFEDETGLTVTDMEIVRPDAAGRAAVASKIRTAVDVVTD